VTGTTGRGTRTSVPTTLKARGVASKAFRTNTRAKTSIVYRKLGGPNRMPPPPPPDCDQPSAELLRSRNGALARTPPPTPHMRAFRAHPTTQNQRLRHNRRSSCWPGRLPFGRYFSAHLHSSSCLSLPPGAGCVEPSATSRLEDRSSSAHPAFPSQRKRQRQRQIPLRVVVGRLIRLRGGDFQQLLLLSGGHLRLKRGRGRRHRHPSGTLFTPLLLGKGRMR